MNLQVTLAPAHRVRNSRAMMFAAHIRVIFLGIVLATGLAAHSVRAEQITIFAASSLKTALDDIAADLPEQIVVSYGGSAAMARQIVQGARADIVMFAHPDWLDWAGEQGAIDAASACIFLSNRLVIAGPKGAEPLAAKTAQDVINRLDGGRLASGHLQSVPAGQYAHAWLQDQGWLDALRPHLAEVSNVRLALALVARGEAPLGLVYHSDVHAEPSVEALFTVPNEAHPPIAYPIAKTTVAGAGAQAVMRALIARTDLFEKHGFSVPDTSDRCQ